MFSNNAYFATLFVHLSDRLDGIQMVDTRIKTNFVQDNDSGLLGFT